MKNTKYDTDRKVITQEEFQRIIDRFLKVVLYIPLQIAYHTGTRVGECCALTWDDVHLDKG